MSDTVNILLVAGVEGPSVYIDQHRVAGNKPWGGGRTLREWNVPRAEVLRALHIDAPKEAPHDPTR